MAIIKCPECGKDVSTAAASCPHCGYPTQKQNNDKAEEKPIEDLPESKSPEWVEKWVRKSKQTKRMLLYIFLGSFAMIGLFVLLLNIDKEITDRGYTYTKTIWAACIGLSALLAIIALTLWITGLLTFRVRIRQYGDYTVVVYVGFKHYLIIEDVISDSGVFNRFLYGQLPDKKQVWVAISAWDGSVKMGIGAEGDEKQVL